jgi:hypothetical protein
MRVTLSSVAGRANIEYSIGLIVVSIVETKKAPKRLICNALWRRRRLPCSCLDLSYVVLIIILIQYFTLSLRPIPS